MTTLINQPLLAVEKITKTHRRQIILDEISLQVFQGQCLGILGENGSGKTTLLQIIAKIIQPTNGSIQYQEGLTIGFVPQEDGFFEEVSALDNLKLWSSHFQSFQHSPFIERLGLTPFLKKPVSQLSGGMKRRLSLASGLIRNPDIIILDEPFSSLDIVYQQELREFINDLLQQHKTVLLSAHDQAGYDLCTDRYWLSQGKLKKLDENLEYDQLYSWLKQGEK